MRNLINELVVSPKPAVVVAMSTTGTGMGTIFDVIPDDIGKLATLVGIILSSVLIYTHSRRMVMDSKKDKLQLDILKEKRREQIENAKRRAEAGEPIRRDYDDFG
jgi:hypothetical protein